jgi:hypothetical protein
MPRISLQYLAVQHLGVGQPSRSVVLESPFQQFCGR